MTFGEILRKQREEKGLLIRQVAAKLEVDTATISKIENGNRHATPIQVKQFSQILDLEYDTLEASWMGNKIYEMLLKVDNPSKALIVAEEQIQYKSNSEL